MRPVHFNSTLPRKREAVCPVDRLRRSRPWCSREPESLPVPAAPIGAMSTSVVSSKMAFQPFPGCNPRRSMPQANPDLGQALLK